MSDFISDLIRWNEVKITALSIKQLNEAYDEFRLDGDVLWQAAIQEELVRRLRMQKFTVGPDRALLGLIIYASAMLVLLTIIYHLVKCTS